MITISNINKPKNVIIKSYFTEVQLEQLIERGWTIKVFTEEGNVDYLTLENKQGKYITVQFPERTDPTKEVLVQKIELDLTTENKCPNCGNTESELSGINDQESVMPQKTEVTCSKCKNKFELLLK